MSRSRLFTSPGTTMTSAAAPSTLHDCAAASTEDVDTEEEARPPAKSPEPKAAAMSTPTATAVIQETPRWARGRPEPPPTSPEQRPLQQLAGREAGQLVDEADLGRALVVRQAVPAPAEELVRQLVARGDGLVGRQLHE